MVIIVFFVVQAENERKDREAAEEREAAERERAERAERAERRAAYEAARTALVRKGAATVNLSGKTDSKTGSVVGRAIVGGVLAGPAGAVVGGATASEKTEMSGTVSFGDDTVLHDYTVRVTVRDIARPSVSIHVGADTAKAAEAAALFEVIIDCNRRG